MTLKVNEIFHSIQGEGITIGVPTTFVRLTGCNLRCEWCDTKYAYDEGREMSTEEILETVIAHDCRQVCVTGGEPLLQKDSISLIETLIERGYMVTLETNGSLTLEELPCSDRFMISMDMKCPSSCMVDKMLISNLELLSPNDQLKFVIADDNDYMHAKSIIMDTKPISNVIMQPAGGTDMKNLTEWILRDKLELRVLPQMHKLIWQENRGV